MASRYINRTGNSVQVSDKHLDIAIKLKGELQKASPSLRCSWAQHKKLMEKEGFDDSDTNENYRCMIKEEQRKRGLFRSNEQELRKETISDSKLKAIKSEIGELREVKLEAQQSFNRMNRLKRELSTQVVMLESIEEGLKNKIFSVIESSPISDNQNYKNQHKTMVAVLSDYHYGAIVDVEGYYYNPEVAENLLMEYADKLISLAIKEGVSEIQVVNIGDLIEHDSMRPQNTYAVNKTWSDQVIDATDTVIKFLGKLTSIGTVRYSAIMGNHDRRAGAKQDALYGDSAINISNKIIETYAKYSGADILFEECEPYHYLTTINNKNFLFVHGDKTPMAKSSILAEQSMLYGKSINVLVGGHIHHNVLKEVGNDKYVVTFGSIKGTDEYSLKTIGSTASRSQGVILINEDGEFEFKIIKL